MDRASSIYRVHQCSKCPGDTAYYCVSCPCDLCPRCKESHEKDLKSIDHHVMTLRNKLSQTQDNSVKISKSVYLKYCETCQVPCEKHGKYKNIDRRTANEEKQQERSKTISTIKSEALFYRAVILTRIKADIKIYRTRSSLYRNDILTKSQTLNCLIDKVNKNFLCNLFCEFDFKHSCLKQRIEISRHIVSLQRYEHRYEQSAIFPLHFLSSIKATFSKIHFTLHTSQLSMTESLNKEDVMKSLSAIQITKKVNRCVGNQRLLKMMCSPEFYQSLTLTGVDGCYHMSCVTSNRVWISGNACSFILANTTGVTLCRVEDLCSGLYGGLHTVNSESEMIYIDRNYNLNKLSNDMKTTSTFIETTDSTWRPHCLYWSPFTKDLLVAMYNYSKETGKVTRYNQSGQLTQTIQHERIKPKLYRLPIYIAENNNGDIVVSDCDVSSLTGDVIVTERGGKHRFSYTGHPSGLELWPRGICTDALSHILVCDELTKTVQMIDRDGRFLSHLLIRPSGIFSPYSLSYDVNTHRLWVGSKDNNNVVVYRYMERHEILLDLNPATTDVMDSLSEIPTTRTEKSQQGNQCLLKLMSPPELLFHLRLKYVCQCYHISCLTSDRVYISDNRNNIILANPKCVTLHHVEDLCKDLYYTGLHTVNSESELLYIDRNYNIKKLSMNMKTTTTFIERTDSTWKPRCVYWSPFNEDLLVAMYSKYTALTGTGKVSRFNKSGQLTQTIQHDNNGMELYSGPKFITENNNGDIVVSDYNYRSGAVVVTERGGRHRFSYTGHPSGSVLNPLGICTDALSHILMCDQTTHAVQMLDRDGQFLSHLLLRPCEILTPYSLSYDVSTHRLWIGSKDNNKVCVYSYLPRKDALTDDHNKERTNSTGSAGITQGEGDECGGNREGKEE